MHLKYKVITTIATLSIKQGTAPDKRQLSSVCYIDSAYYLLFAIEGEHV